MVGYCGWFMWLWLIIHGFRKSGHFRTYFSTGTTKRGDHLGMSQFYERSAKHNPNHIMNQSRVDEYQALAFLELPSDLFHIAIAAMVHFWRINMMIDLSKVGDFPYSYVINNQTVKFIHFGSFSPFLTAGPISQREMGESMTMTCVSGRKSTLWLPSGRLT